MQPKWLNNGEPDENGDIIAVIENNAGQRISTFKGKSVKEVADKILDSQANANREIARLRRPDKSKGPEPLTLAPKELTAGDKLRLASEITDPEKVVDAVSEIVTAAQGASPKQVAAAAATSVGNLSDQYYRTEAEEFVKNTPEYYPVPQNQDKLLAAMERNKIDFTRNNLAIVFQTLQDQGEMIPWPAEQDEEPQQEPESEAQPISAAPNGQRAPNPPTPIVVTTRPRSVSTGIRSSDASGFKPRPTAPKKITRADLEGMSRAEYENRLRSEPGFRDAVNALG